MGTMLCRRRAGEAEDLNTNFKKEMETTKVKRSVAESEEGDSDDHGTKSEENTKVKNTNFEKNRETLGSSTTREAHKHRTVEVIQLRGILSPPPITAAAVTADERRGEAEEAAVYEDDDRSIARRWEARRRSMGPPGNSTAQPHQSAAVAAKRLPSELR